MSKTTRSPNLHKVSDAGTREGISFQPLPDKAETHRNSARLVSNGETDQNLVSEQEDEAEEGIKSGERD